MSQKRAKNNPEKEKSDVAFVRLGSERAEWLQSRKGRSLPDKIKRIIDREMIKEELQRKK